MSSPDWKRLGRLLTERRVELGFPRRLPWARDVLGLSHDRTLSDLENARRDNYDATTLAQVEQWYEWEPGSIELVLEGGSPLARLPRPTRVDIQHGVPGQHLWYLNEKQLQARVDDLAAELVNVIDRIADLAANRERLMVRLEEANAALADLRAHGGNNLLSLHADEHEAFGAAARDTGQLSKGQQRRGNADRAGEPDPDDPNDVEPR